MNGPCRCDGVGYFHPLKMTETPAPPWYSARTSKIDPTAAKTWGTSLTKNPCVDLVLGRDFNGGDVRVWVTSPVASEVPGSNPGGRPRAAVAQSGRARTCLRHLVLTTDFVGRQRCDGVGSFWESVRIRSGNATALGEAVPEATWRGQLLLQVVLAAAH